MATSSECDVAWARGFTEGYMKNWSTKPSIPSRPASFPPGVDPLTHFHGKGYEAGYKAGLQSAAGISKPS